MSASARSSGHAPPLASPPVPAGVAAPPLWDVRGHLPLAPGGAAAALELGFATDARRVVLHGPSGAGKSLSLQLLAGLRAPTRGRLRFAGRTLFDSDAGVDLSPQERGLALVFQDYALFPHLSVRQNLAFGLHRGWRNPPSRARAGDDALVGSLLQRFGLEGLAERRPGSLSGGQRQRVALARALAARPRALLLDEPFAALDAPLRRRLHDELEALLAEWRLPLLLVTHDAEDVERFGDAVLSMAEGRVTGLRERASPAP